MNEKCTSHPSWNKTILTKNVENIFEAISKLATIEQERLALENPSNLQRLSVNRFRIFRKF